MSTSPEPTTAWPASQPKSGATEQTTGGGLSSPLGPPDGVLDESYLLRWAGHDGEWYVPIFSLATDAVGTAAGASTQQRYRITLAPDGAAWVLTIQIVQTPSDKLRGSPMEIRNARPLTMAGAYGVSLTYTVETADSPKGDYRKRADFAVTVAPDGLSASLRLETPADQAEVYAALTVRDLDARIAVSRTCEIAIPFEIANPDAGPLSEQLRRFEAMQICYVGSVIRQGKYLSGAGLADSPTPLFVENFSGHDVVQDGDLVRLRLDGGKVLTGSLGNENAAKAGDAIDPAPPYQRLFLRGVKAVGTRIPVGTSGPYRLSFGGIDLSVAADLNDIAAQMMRAFVFTNVDSADPMYAQKRTLIQMQKDRIDALPRLYDATRTTIVRFDSPLTLQPTPLDLRKHPYVFKVPAPGDFVATGLIEKTAGSNVYYQDAGRAQRFYYLPDRYAFGKKSDESPNVVVRATTNSDAYLVSYVAVPYTDARRLEADRTSLSPSAPTAVEFSPLLGDALSFALNMPQGPAWVNVARPGAVTDLHSPIVDAFTLSADELRMLYDAITTGQTSLFHGVVSVELGNWSRQNISFEGEISGTRDLVWDEIFDPTIPATFAREITVSAVDSAFKGADAISVSFVSGDAVTLRRTATTAKAMVSQPIAEFVMSRLQAGEYDYTITYVSSGGTYVPPLKGKGIGNTLDLT